MPPIPNNDHQDVQLGIACAIRDAIQKSRKGLVQAGANVTDRHPDWMKNFRVPDVVAYLFTNPAINHNTHWTGGPDFLVEVLSPGERAYDKFDFYASVHAREILLVFRNPWMLELHHLDGENYRLAARNELDDSTILASETLPLTFHLSKTHTRPAILIRHTEDGREWDA